MAFVSVGIFVLPGSDECSSAIGSYGCGSAGDMTDQTLIVPSAVGLGHARRKSHKPRSTPAQEIWRSRKTMAALKASECP
jgi:hypothetical protein